MGPGDKGKEGVKAFKLKSLGGRQSINQCKEVGRKGSGGAAGARPGVFVDVLWRRLLPTALTACWHATVLQSLIPLQLLSLWFRGSCLITAQLSTSFCQKGDTAESRF